MNRQDRALADGRDIFFYDQHPVERKVHDPRDLPQVATSSQLRYDPLLIEWVIMAGHRQSRTFLPPADQCPLCPSTTGRDTEIPASSYEVVGLDNRCPSLTQDAQSIADDDANPAAACSAWLHIRAGVGRCEVLCLTDNTTA